MYRWQWYGSLTSECVWKASNGCLTVVEWWVKINRKWFKLGVVTPYVSLSPSPCLFLSLSHSLSLCSVVLCLLFFVILIFFQLSYIVFQLSFVSLHTISFHVFFNRVSFAFCCLSQSFDCCSLSFLSLSFSLSVTVLCCLSLTLSVSLPLTFLAYQLPINCLSIAYQLWFIDTGSLSLSLFDSNSLQSLLLFDSYSLSLFLLAPLLGWVGGGVGSSL